MNTVFPEYSRTAFGPLVCRPGTALHFKYYSRAASPHERKETESNYTLQKGLLSIRATLSCYEATYRAQCLGMQRCWKALGNVGFQFRLSIWVVGTEPTCHPCIWISRHALCRPFCPPHMLHCCSCCCPEEDGAGPTPSPTLCPMEIPCAAWSHKLGHAWRFLQLLMSPA